jgi:lipoprotein LprG
MNTRRRTRSALAVVSVLTPLLLSACSSGGGEELDAEQRLASAKSALDKTTGVQLVLEAEKLPQGVNGLLRAEGVGTHDPAFEGKLNVAASGVTANVDIVAVDGVVHARLPFTKRFVPIDPVDYGAPDPADLMSTDGGLSSLLTAAEGVEEGEEVRDGDVVLSQLTGTVPGSAVSSVIPSAAEDADFDAVFSLDDDDRLDSVELTGPFYPDAGDVTYTVEFADYDVEKDIVAP